MDNKRFYQILDYEIDEIIEEFKEDEYIKKQQKNNKKAYGFLLWFLKNNLPIDYSNIDDYKQFIVDGNDDNSCDIIFNNNSSGEDIFYVVQAKWFNESKINNSNEISKEFKACITDFNLMLSGEKKFSVINEKFNEKYKELLYHKSKNGKIRFIFAALCKSSEDFRIKEIEEGYTNELVKTYIYDIGMIKKTYIDLNYRGLRSDNPLESPFISKNNIDLYIEKSNFIEVSNNTNKKSYIFITNAEEIYNLYNKFGNALFLKNIRNPGNPDNDKEFYNNKRILETALNSPESFWYYNNGITAITNNILPFYQDNDLITLEGIQVINGAQTLTTIYEAYNKANIKQRKAIKENLKVTIRVVMSQGNELDLKMTKYTNSQTVTIPRDFYCNDDIQKKLYDDFLANTGVIYERRRGEFIKDKIHKDYKDIDIISNEILAQKYMAYFLEQPMKAKSNKKLIFKSKEDGGYYEDIFNCNTNYKDMLIGYRLFAYIDNKLKELEKNIKLEENKAEKEIFKSKHNSLKYFTYEMLGVFKIFLNHKNNNNYEITRNTLFSKLNKDGSELDDIYEVIADTIHEFINSKLKEEKNLSLSAYAKRQTTYTEIKEYTLEKYKNAVESEEVSNKDEVLDLISRCS